VSPSANNDARCRFSCDTGGNGGEGLCVCVRGGGPHYMYTYYTDHNNPPFFSNCTYTHLLSPISDVDGCWYYSRQFQHPPPPLHQFWRPFSPFWRVKKKLWLANYLISSLGNNRTRMHAIIYATIDYLVSK